MIENKEPNCDNCKTSFGYIRLGTKEWVCRKCGKTTKQE